MAGFKSKPTSLPSATFDLDDIRDLKNTLYESLHKLQIKITISREGTDNQYSSFEEFFQTRYYRQ